MHAVSPRYRARDCTATDQLVAVLSLYNRYNTGNRKIHTRSTKCQYSPVYSMRFVNCSGFVFHIFAPGPMKYAITTMPPRMCMPCRPVSVK